MHWYEPSRARGWIDSKDGGPAFEPIGNANPLVSPNEMSGALPDVLNQFKTLCMSDNSIETNEIGMMTTSKFLLKEMMLTLTYQHPGILGTGSPLPHFGNSIWFDGDGNQPTNPYKAKPLHITDIDYSPPHVVSLQDLTTLGIYLVDHRWIPIHLPE